MFVGRETEIDKIYQSLNSEKKITLILGEAGIGKSALLKAFRHRIWINSDYDYLVGYYDDKDELRSGSIIYPFVIVLRHFLDWIIEKQSSSEKLKETIGRIERVFIKLLKEKGTEIDGAIIQAISEKIGLKETSKIAKEFLGKVKDEESPLMIAERYVNEHGKQTVSSYVEIFSSLQQEFKEFNLLLIFDQFESVSKASIDFLIDFLRKMPDKMHVILSFQTEDDSWNDIVSSKLVEYAINIIKRQGTNIITINGLTIEEIQKWVKSSRGKDLAIIPDLKRIRENTSGFPLLLDEWINQSTDLNYKELEQIKVSNKRDIVRNYVLKRKGLLSNEKDVIINLNKISILTIPLESSDLSFFLQMKIDDVEIFLEKLIEYRIFERKNDYPWFRHELIQKFLEESLTDEYRKKCHEYASVFYIHKLKKGIEKGYVSNDVYIGCAYHLHNAGNMPDESININTDLAHRAVNIGDLDLAEKCYKRVIEDINDEKYEKELIDSYLNLAHDVLVVWGRYSEALEIYQQLLDICKIPEQRIRTLSFMAQIYYIKKDYEEALNLYMTSISLADTIENRSIKAELLHSLGLIYYDQQEYDEALKLFLDCNSLMKVMKNKLGVISSNFYIANIYRSKKRYDESLQLLQDSLVISKRSGYLDRVAEIFHGMANVYYDRQEYDTALNLLQHRLVIEKKIGNQAGIAVTLLNIGKIRIKEKKFDEAFPYIKDAYFIFKDLGLAEVHDAFKELKIIQNFLASPDYNV